MMKLFGRVMLAAMLAVGMWMMAGCEDHTIGGEMLDAIKGDDSDNAAETQTQTTVSASTPNSSSVSAKDVSGTWNGKAGTAQGHVTLRLVQNGDKLSGSWTYSNGDKRNCTGSRSGNSITLHDNKSGGSTWRATVSSDGRSISGTGYKTDGRTYPLSFSR